MATIDELEAQGENMKACEAAAVCALAEGMRELAVSLPQRLAPGGALRGRGAHLGAVCDWARSGAGDGLVDSEFRAPDVPRLDAWGEAWLMTLRGVDTPKGDPSREAEAFLRIMNVLTDELPALRGCPHWYRAAETLRDRLADSALRRGSPRRFQRIDGGED